MTIKIPIRTIYNANSDPTGLGEFQSGETIGYLHGGTGLSTIGTAGQTLVVNDSASGLEWGAGFAASDARTAISVTDAGGDGSLAYNSSTGVLTYTGPSASEVRAHISGGTGVTISSGSISIGQAVGTTDNVTFNTVTADLTGDVTGTVSSLSNHDTDDLTEGSTNLYYTDTRARASVSATDAGGDGSLAYNSSTGVFTYTGPSASEVRAHFSAGTGVTISNGQVSIGQAVGTTDSAVFASLQTTGNIVVGGDLTVNGTTTTVNSTTLDVADKNITVASGAADAATANGAGLTVDGASATITYSSTGDKWAFNKPIDVSGNIIVSGTVDGRDLATDGSKLDGIESGATADQSDAEIKTAYENNSDTNAFTDALLSKLNNIEANATADQSASEILTAIKTVDGAGSGLDADTLDGTQAAAFALLAGATFTGDVSAPNFNSTSDAQLKENVVTITSALDKVDSIRGVTFDWKDTGKTSMGVIAQEVETIAPEVVSEIDGYKAVNYDGLIGLLIESIKELKQEISDLKQN